MSYDASRCTFAWPGTYGHECGKPATLTAAAPSEYTVDGIFWARRCASCAAIKGGENAGLSSFVPFDPKVHINNFRRARA